jgi:hypothetical protein
MKKDREVPCPVIHCNDYPGETMSKAFCLETKLDDEEYVREK